MRVYELAKELDTTSKDLIGKLDAMGVEVKNHMSSVPDEAIATLRGGETEPAPAAKQAQPAPPSEPTVKPAPAAPPKPAAKPAPAAAPIPKGKPVSAPPTAAPVPTPPAAEEGDRRTPLPTEEAPPNPVIKISGPVTVKMLATKLGLRPNLLVTELMRMNILASINEAVDFDAARKVCIRHGFMLEIEKKPETPKPPPPKPLELEEDEPDRAEDLQPCPPVVTFLGHVDHGKTSLLDRIRNAQVAVGESGGITQHIGAYTVDLDGRKITFLDTPGHAAFTAMRARGANLTDIAVIVIAADDGIMPQTREAIQHAKAAGVSIVVAINKTDLPAANVDRVKQQLLNEGLTPEDWGGEIICVPVSAHSGEGIDDLLEMLLLQAEVLDIKANPSRRARGYVIEAQLEQGMGPTANLLVKAGTLKVGDPVVCGAYCGRVRALVNDHGVKVKSAGPATPVKCLGLAGVPPAGSEFRVCVSEKLARTVAYETEARLKEGQLQAARKPTLDTLFEHMEDSQKIELKVILKADTQGSVEAITHALQQIKSNKVSLSILLSGTGNITVNDVLLASASDAVIIGFHIGKESQVPAVAKREGVEVVLHTIIYELLDRVQEAMTGLLAPRKEERVRGSALVKQKFDLGKRGCVAGCMVTKGHVRPSYRVRVRREADVLYEGSIVSLRHYQDEVAEVRESQECGIRLDNYTDFTEGDVLEFYEIEEVKQSL